jgi:hypothetical protein
MSGRSSKAKGYRGEVEVMSLIAEMAMAVCNQLGVPPPELARSPNGRDIRGISWIAIEVKRVEADNPSNLLSWWEQAKSQAQVGQEPVLFYRKNNSPWNIRMFGFLDANGSRIRCPVDIGLPAFRVWFSERYKSTVKVQAI